MCACAHVCGYVRVSACRGQRHQILWSWSGSRLWAAQCGYWVPNSGLQKEQCTLSQLGHLSSSQDRPILKGTLSTLITVKIYFWLDSLSNWQGLISRSILSRPLPNHTRWVPTCSPEQSGHSSNQQTPHPNCCVLTLAFAFVTFPLPWQNTMTSYRRKGSFGFMAPEGWDSMMAEQRHGRWSWNSSEHLDLEPQRKSREKTGNGWNL